MAEYIERTSELILAANAGARVIENTKRYHGSFYIRDVFAPNHTEIAYLQAAKVLRDIEDAPAADVAPVVHGHWIDKMVRDWHCSECNYQMAKVRNFDGYCYDDKPNFCPNCGADMRELPEPPKEGEHA